MIRLGNDIKPQPAPDLKDTVFSPVEPLQYPSVNLNFIISSFFAIIATPALPLDCGKPSHVILKMTLSQVYRN